MSLWPILQLHSQINKIVPIDFVNMTHSGFKLCSQNTIVLQKCTFLYVQRVCHVNDILSHRLTAHLLKTKLMHSAHRDAVGSDTFDLSDLSWEMNHLFESPRPGWKWEKKHFSVRGASSRALLFLQQHSMVYNTEWLLIESWLVSISCFVKKHTVFVFSWSKMYKEICYPCRMTTEYLRMNWENAME